MSNKEGKKTNKFIDQERARTGREHEYAMGYLNPERAGERERATNERNELWKGYQSFLDPNLNTGGGGGGGGYQLQGTWADLGNKYRNLSGNLESAAGTFGGLARGGNYDERIRKTYGDFADTGGLSADDVSNLRGRGIAGIGSYFDAARRELGRRSVAAGGNKSGLFSAFNERAAREQARAISDASRDTELGITDRRNQGRLAGAQGLFGLDEGMNRNRLAGASGLADIGKFGYQGLEQFADREQSVADANAAAAGRGAADERYRQGLRMDALDRMSGLYGSSPGELSRYDDMLMRERGLAGGQQHENLGLRASYNPNQSAWDRAMQVAGIAGNVAGIWNPFGSASRVSKRAPGYNYGAMGPI